MSKSAIVSGMGLAMSVIAKLVEAVKGAGGNDDDVHCLATPEGEDIVKEVGKVIARRGNARRGKIDTERYNELIVVFNNFIHRHDGMPAAYILAEMRLDGTVPFGEDIRKDVEVFLRETRIPPEEVQAWACEKLRALDPGFGSPFPTPEQLTQLDKFHQQVVGDEEGDEE